jgi:hypothetical protein
MVCSWWNCSCRQFAPLTRDEPRQERKPLEEQSHANPIAVAEVAPLAEAAAIAETVPIADIVPAAPAPPIDEALPIAEAPPIPEAAPIPEVPPTELEELRSQLLAAQEEIERLKHLQNGNAALATRLGTENDQLRQALAEIKRLVEARLTPP